MTQYKAPRGTHDIYGQMALALEELDKISRAVFRKRNFKEIKTPMFEDVALFTRSIGEATDIVLRGYENGSGGTSTKLRSKESMKAYTWCKKSYIADSGYQNFADGYIGALTARSSWSKKILREMGNYSAADLVNLGNISGSADIDFSSGGGGGGKPLTQADIQKMIEQYKNAYPVHSEYTTYSGSGGNLFESASNNAFSTATLASDAENKSRAAYFMDSKNK